MWQRWPCILPISRKLYTSFAYIWVLDTCSRLRHVYSRLLGSLVTTVEDSGLVYRWANEKKSPFFGCRPSLAALESLASGYTRFFDWQLLFGSQFLLFLTTPSQKQGLLALPSAVPTLFIIMTIMPTFEPGTYLNKTQRRKDVGRRKSVGKIYHSKTI